MDYSCLKRVVLRWATYLDLLQHFIGQLEVIVDIYGERPLWLAWLLWCSRSRLLRFNLIHTVAMKLFHRLIGLGDGDLRLAIILSCNADGNWAGGERAMCRHAGSR